MSEDVFPNLNVPKVDDFTTRLAEIGLDRTVAEMIFSDPTNPAKITFFTPISIGPTEPAFDWVQVRPDPAKPTRRQIVRTRYRVGTLVLEPLPLEGTRAADACLLLPPALDVAPGSGDRFIMNGETYVTGEANTRGVGPGDPGILPRVIKIGDREFARQQKQ